MPLTIGWIRMQIRILHYFQKKKSKIIHKTVGIKVLFLLFLLDDEEFGTLIIIVSGSAILALQEVVNRRVINTVYV